MMAGCPYPELCGVLPALSCLNCSTSAHAGCPHPEWCTHIKCGSDCMDGMPMPDCPDPGACGLTPTPCVGCIVGNSTAGQPTATDTLQLPHRRTLSVARCCPTLLKY